MGTELTSGPVLNSGSVGSAVFSGLSAPSAGQAAGKPQVVLMFVLNIQR